MHKLKYQTKSYCGKSVSVSRQNFSLSLPSLPNPHLYSSPQHTLVHSQSTHKLHQQDTKKSTCERLKTSLAWPALLGRKSLQLLGSLLKHTSVVPCSRVLHVRIHELVTVSEVYRAVLSSIQVFKNNERKKLNIKLGNSPSLKVHCLPCSDPILCTAKDGLQSKVAPVLPELYTGWFRMLYSLHEINITV